MSGTEIASNIIEELLVDSQAFNDDSFPTQQPNIGKAKKFV